VNQTQGKESPRTKDRRPNYLATPPCIPGGPENVSHYQIIKISY